MKAPGFWQEDGLPARLLAPAGGLYAAAGALRWALAGRGAAPLRVVCVGNATVGGTGKTPIAIDLLARLRSHGRKAHGLARGYGGRLRGPVRVDPNRHLAEEVGDEALLLAAVAPTWAGPDRLAGAEAAARVGAEVAVLDDGLQYPRLAKHTSLLVVDTATGFGNGRVVPAGPLREPLAWAQARADALVLVGDGPAPMVLGKLPAFRARLMPAPGATSLAGTRALAFAGIGRPDKFAATARVLGIDVVDMRAFADHHRYRVEELEALAERAQSLGAELLTTAKDAVRLSPSWRKRVRVLHVHVAWDAPDAFESWLVERLDAT